MVFKSHLLVAVCACIVFVSLSANAAFTYDIAAFTQDNGTNTFNDQFSDGIEPPSGSVSDSDYAIRPWTLSTTFGPNRESGGLLELNSDDAEIGKDGDNMIGAFLNNPDYFYSPNAGGSVTGAFQINNGFYNNTWFGIDIDNFDPVNGTPENPALPGTLEEAFFGVYTDPSGHNFAIWGDTAGTSTLDITGDLTGITEITMSLLMNTSNQVTARFDYGSNGSYDLIIDNFTTFSFTPDDPNDVFSGGFVAGENVVPIPAAVWLFGSGLIGLVGVARRKTRT